MGAHSEAWTPVLLLLFTQMEKLQEDRLRRFAAAVYPLLCQLWCADLRPEVCSVIRSLFLRVGAVYGISNLTDGVDHHHGEVGMWPLDAKKREDTLSSIVI